MASKIPIGSGNKPVGWRNDSIEHGLAAKGIKTRRHRKRISEQVNPQTTSHPIRTRGRVHYFLKQIEDKPIRQSDIGETQFGMENVQNALVLGLAERKQVGSKVYYSQTKHGKEAFEKLEKKQPWKKLRTKAYRGSISGGNISKPKGFKFVPVKVKISKPWLEHSKIRHW